MIIEIAVGIVLGLAAARIVALLAGRLWEQLAEAYLMRIPKNRRIRAWFWFAAAMFTGKEWR